MINKNNDFVKITINKNDDYAKMTIVKSTIMLYYN